MGPSWETASPRPLEPAAVHVWGAVLEPGPLGIDDDVRLLTSGEAQRARAFKATSDAERFVVARATLRRFLGDYLTEAPDRVVIAGSPPEKPHIARRQDAPDIRFNVAHAGTLGLFAFALGAEVGIDCELRSSLGTVNAAISKAATPEERDRLATMSAQRRAEEGLRLWTRKEAILKGLGTGLRTPPDSLEIGITPTVPRPQLITAAGRQWTLFDLPELPDAYGSLAVEGDSVEPPGLFLRR